LFIQCLFDSESPEKPCNRDECPLFCESLATAYTSAPSKGHVALFTGEGTVIGTVFQISIWVEAVWLGELAFMVMDGPDVALDPGSLRDEPALDRHI
jgi:hypothetical protein